MTDVAETVSVVTPSQEVTLIYFTATKAAQNDTITFSDYRKVMWCHVHNWASASDSIGTEDATIDKDTVNMINLPSATTGTIRGVAIVIR